MKKFMFRSILSLTLLALFSVGLSADAPRRKRPPVPEQIEETIPKAPSPEHVWVQGNWEWNRKKKTYIWRQGAWERPRRQRVINDPFFYDPFFVGNRAFAYPVGFRNRLLWRSQWAGGLYCW
ncbi:MAG: hypothetical protein AAFV80_06470 [Bacteroidota bacterium]